jgi:hypothetical protein
MNSFNETLEHYRALLLAQREHRLQLPNDNLDTGTDTGGAKYRLTDQTYARLVLETSGRPVSDALRRDLLSYYADLDKPFATKRNLKAWHEVIRELDALKSTPVAGISPPSQLASQALALRHSQEPTKPDGTLANRWKKAA